MKKITSSATDSLIKFPTLLSIKAMGLASDNFAHTVERLVQSHLQTDQLLEVTMTPSSKGKYVSVRIKFEARDQGQLERIYADLHAHDRVLYTL